MIYTTTAYNIVRGVCLGATFHRSRAAEVSMRKGRHDFYNIAILQTKCASLALAQAAPLVGREILSLKSSLLLNGLLYGVGKAIKKVEWGKTHRVALFVHDHIGTLFQIAMIISSIALIALGHVAMGSASLISLGIGFLDTRGFLPQKVQWIFNKTTLFLSYSMGILSGNLFLKGLSVISFSAWTVEKLGTLKEKFDDRNDRVAIRGDQLSFGNLDAVSQGIFQTEKKHMNNVSSLPPSLNISFQEIQEMGGHLKWSDKELGVLRQKISTDARSQVHDIANVNDTDLIKYFHTLLGAFVKRIETLKEGSFSGLAIARRLEYVIQHLQDKATPTERNDALMRFAIEGGEYCDAGKIILINELYKNCGNRAATLKETLYSLLETKRQFIFKIMLDEEHCKPPSLMRSLWALNDVDQRDKFFRAFQYSFGLHNLSTKLNPVVTECDHFQLLSIKIAFGHFHSIFWENYTKENILDEVKLDVADHKTPYYAWWRNWAESQPNSQKKTEFLTNLANGELEDNGGELKIKYLKAMLYEMGIFKIAANP